MGDKFASLVKEDKLLLEFFSRVVGRVIRKKQKALLLNMTREGNGVTVTALVREISRKLNCSRSALWNNVNELKYLNLIECGCGKPAKLTPLGVLVKGFVVKEEVGEVEFHKDVKDVGAFSGKGFMGKRLVNRQNL
jgi:hypothetical protein